jgi:hypothetical protein
MNGSQVIFRCKTFFLPTSQQSSSIVADFIVIVYGDC